MKFVANTYGAFAVPEKNNGRGENSSRRSVIAGIVCCATGGKLSRAQPGTGESFQGLDQLARVKGMKFGSEIRGEELRDQQYCRLVRKDCGIVVAGNELKWQLTEPRPNVMSFEGGNSLLDFSDKNGLKFRGTNLVWNRPENLPKWVNEFDFGRNSGRLAEKIITRHIISECKHYKSVISWDVVNEAIDQDSGAMRETVLSKVLGDELVELCFQIARHAAPDAELVYNDYMSWNLSSTKHRAGVLRLLERLRKHSTPVDALGIQSHIGPRLADGVLGNSVQEDRDWRRFLDDVTGMGYRIVLTELDIRDDYLTAMFESRDQVAADYVKRYLDLTLSYKQVKHVISWGMVDKYSWLKTAAPEHLGQARRPLPYDSSYQAKPIRDAIARALVAAPVR